VPIDCLVHVSHQSLSRVLVTGVICDMWLSLDNRMWFERHTWGIDTCHSNDTCKLLTCVIERHSITRVNCVTPNVSSNDECQLSHMCGFHVWFIGTNTTNQMAFERQSLVWHKSHRVCMHEHLIPIHCLTHQALIVYVIMNWITSEACKSRGADVTTVPIDCVMWEASHVYA